MYEFGILFFFSSLIFWNEGSPKSGWMDLRRQGSEYNQNALFEIPKLSIRICWKEIVLSSQISWSVQTTFTRRPHAQQLLANTYTQKKQLNGIFRDPCVIMFSQGIFF